MQSKPSAIVETRARFFSEIAADLEETGRSLGLEMEAPRLSAILEQGVMVVAAGCYARETGNGDHDVGLVGVATPKDLALRAGKTDLPPGTYLVRLGKDGSVRFDSGDGAVSIPVAPAGTLRAGTGGGGGGGGCSTGWQLEVSYRNCQICLTLVCPGRFVVLLGCISIPFCDVFTGLVEVFA